MAKKGISILGSTGSIGRSSLEVIAGNPDQFEVIAISGNQNIPLLAEQVRQFKPQLCALAPGKTPDLVAALGDFPAPLILEGPEGFEAVATHPQASLVIAAMVGAVGIKPVLSAIAAKKDIALANKECIVLAGELVMQAVQQAGVKLLPVDSEHNAIFQCLAGANMAEVESITLTASGGPFRSWPLDEFSVITKADALNHPNWSMGSKITIDSATMMNKALEIIEAKWLFNLKPSQIKVLVHKESIIHSMVTYQDHSFLAQLGVPDMRIPIAHCLGYPNRIESTAPRLNLAKIGQLHFEEPDFVKFPTLQLAYECLELGGGATAALNGANEVLVEMFLQDKIHFTKIFRLLVRLVEELKFNRDCQTPRFLLELKTLEDALAADQWGRKFITTQLYQ